MILDYDIKVCFSKLDVLTRLVHTVQWNQTLHHLELHIILFMKISDIVQTENLSVSKVVIVPLLCDKTVT
jgi:hypothetical protein